ncbi:MAG: tetratricopeptide repeat protein [Phycisphaerae bacterium]|nr:tetratricopeptide repeat protein [Phycisphaerae bacterium]
MKLDAEGFEIEDGVDLHYRVLKELGDCYATLGRHGEAWRCYRQAAELSPEQSAPLVGLGVVALQQGRLDSAASAFDDARRLNPACAEAYSGLAMVCQQRRDFAGAFDFYLQCLQFNSDNLVALLGLFQASCQMGTFGKIIHYLERYLDRHPGDTSVLFCLASLYAREGQLLRAQDALLTVLALDPDKPDAQKLLDDVTYRLRQQPMTA